MKPEFILEYGFVYHTYYMKTFKQTVSENQVGNELYKIKLKIAEWWKENSNNPQLKSEKKRTRKTF
jgi:hypothetical protein